MIFKRLFWLGAGLVVVYEFLPQIIKTLRPVALQAAKAGLAAADKIKLSSVETKESWDDLMAEARAQYEEEKGLTVEKESRPRQKKAAKK